MTIARPQFIIFPPTKALSLLFLCWRNAYLVMKPSGCGLAMPHMIFAISAL